MLIVLAIAAGCANMVRKQVTEADRDKSGQYDSSWEVWVQDAPLKQHIDQWVFTCKDMKRELGMIVRNGTASMRINGQTHESYVDKEGKFRLEIPLSSKTREKTGSSSSVTAGDNTLVIQGILAGAKPSGFYTAGVAQFGNNGCTARVMFVRNPG